MKQIIQIKHNEVKDCKIVEALLFTSVSRGFNKLKVRGGLDNVAGKSRELNSWLLIGIYLYKIPQTRDLYR